LNLAPITPRFLSKQCSYNDQQSAILAWSIDDIGPVQGFLLELNQGILIDSNFEVKKKLFFLL